MHDHPYRPPNAALDRAAGQDGRPETTALVRLRAAQLSGAGLATATVGTMLCLLTLGVPVLLARAEQPFDGEEQLVVGMAGTVFAVVLVGGLALWRRHASARLLLAPMVLCSLPFLPLVPLLAGTVAWAAWTGPGPAALRGPLPGGPLAPREVLPWFLLTGALLGVGQPVLLVLLVLLVG